MALLDFSGSPHGGRAKLLPENDTAPHITPRLLVLHTVVGGAAGAERYFRTGTNLESHFVVAGRWGEGELPDGYILQLMDTARRADAQYKANAFALSIETGDDGSPNDTPWTSRQLDALAWLLKELARIHDIPLRLVDRWDGTGIAWHAQFGAPSQLTPVRGKECPGRARIAQIPALIERARTGGEGDLSMADADSIQDAITALRRDLEVFGSTGLADTIEDFAARQREALAELGRVKGMVDALNTRVDKLVESAGTTPGVVTDEQLTKVVAELRGGLAQPVGAYIAALEAGAHQAAAQYLSQSAASGGAA